MILCPTCQHENPEGTLICAQCGKPIDRAIFKSTQSTRKMGSDDFGGQKLLLLHLATSNQYIQVDLSDPDGVVIGRSDPESDWTPAIDLSAFEVKATGISRQHARLTRQDNGLFITDLGSANGTLINESQLPVAVASRLRDGDIIRLATVVINVIFADPA